MEGYVKFREDRNDKLFCEITKEEARKIEEIYNYKTTLQRVMDELLERMAAVELDRTDFWKEMKDKYKLERGKKYRVNTVTYQVTEVLDDSEPFFEVKGE